MRVLVVDDQAVSRDLVRQMLEMRGHEVVGATADGAGALASVRSVEVDVVLVDQGLGVERGFDVVRLLRAEKPGLPVVLMSMDAAPPAEYIQASGASGFITKERLLRVDLGSLLE
jgi:two-component system invasion response regulator UvrY